MALIAEILRCFMLQVTVHAVQSVLIVRRHVRIGGLDVFRPGHQILGVVATRTGLNCRDFRILGIHIFSVAALARQTACNMAVGTEVTIRCTGSRTESKAEHHNRGKHKFFHSFLLNLLSWEGSYGGAPVPYAFYSNGISLRSLPPAGQVFQKGTLLLSAYRRAFMR